MTTARVDPELGLVYPVVLTFGDQPPQEIGVVQADNGAEQALVDLVALLHDAADVMLVGGDEAIALARHRYASLLTQDTRRAQDAIVAGAYVPGQYSRDRAAATEAEHLPAVLVHEGPAVASTATTSGIRRTIHEGHADDCAVCNPHRLAAHHSDYEATGGARLVEHLAGGVTCCAHHVPLSQSCQACGR